MKRTYFILLLIIFTFGCKEINTKKDAENSIAAAEPSGTENVGYKWGQMALTATANDTERFQPRPTITSRYLGLIFVAVFDAWSRYDQKAIPVYLNEVERRPNHEHSLRNKEIAISYAAFRAISEYYYSDKKLFTDFMTELGL